MSSREWIIIDLPLYGEKGSFLATHNSLNPGCQLELFDPTTGEISYKLIGDVSPIEVVNNHFSNPIQRAVAKILNAVKQQSFLSKEHTPIFNEKIIVKRIRYLL